MVARNTIHDSSIQCSSPYNEKVCLHRSVRVLQNLQLNMRRKRINTWIKLTSIAAIATTSIYFTFTMGIAATVPFPKNDVINVNDVRATQSSNFVVAMDYEEPKWRSSLLGQQKRKKVLVDRMKWDKAKWKVIGKSWGNQLPDDHCETTHFINNATASLPGGHVYGRRVALASFPGSGNTWLRHLFHVTTGVWTGSVYFDPKLYHGGFPGEACSCNDSMTFAVKVHDLEHARAVGCVFDDVIFVLRSPYRSILSEFNRRKGQSHTGVARSEDYASEDWSSYASKKIFQFKSVFPSWVERCRTFSKQGNPGCLIINYEDLKGNPQREMKRVLTHLEMPLGRLKCLNKPEMATGPFYRKHDVTGNDVSEEQNPVCQLERQVRSMLYDVTMNASVMVRELEGGEGHSREIIAGLPSC